jgi:hypothetical protein
VPKLPLLSGTEIVQALESKVGTFSGILRQAQLPAEDFLDALK